MAARRAAGPFFLIILCAFLVRATLLQAFTIPSGSMTPTLEPGDHVVVTPYGNILHKERPSRGDVIVFRSPGDNGVYLAKRVVAVPGDHVEIRHGEVWLNGRLLDEPYVQKPKLGEQVAPQTLPQGRYFVLGDHRVDSVDSRTWGFLDERMILGKARLIFWSRDEEQGGPPIELIRWERIFRPVR